MGVTAMIAQQDDPRRQEFNHDAPVATWWRQQSPGTYYWRCLLPARRLPGQVLAFKSDDGVPVGDGIVWPRLKGPAIWQFPGNATTGTLMAGMQGDGIRVLMEMDDSYQHIPEGGLNASWQTDFDTSGVTDRHSFAAHRELARWVDGIIVATEPLAELYGELNPNIWICPNQIEPDDWPDPSELPEPDGVLRIGWGASHSHIADAPLMKRAFKWAAAQPNVEVWVFGIGDVYRFGGGVKKAPWTDNLADYRASLARCDVMVCPLLETPWSRYKSDLKALEACMAGAWPIVSTASPYKPWHDRTMTCGTAKEWEAALRWTVRNRDQIPALTAKAREYVLGERTNEKNIGLWRDALNG